MIRSIWARRGARVVLAAAGVWWLTVAAQPSSASAQTGVCGDAGDYSWDLLRTYRLGAECSRHGAEHPNGEAIVDDIGSLTNWGATREFVCPLESRTDNNTLPALGCPEEIAIYVRDGHPSQNVACQVFATDPFGLIRKGSITRFSTLAGPNTQKLTWTQFNPKGRDFWGIDCVLPGLTGIVGYYMDELDMKDFDAEFP